MIAYFFRFMDGSTPSEFVGFALAQNADDMIWRIDEHGDPYQCQVKTATHFSWSAMWTEEGDRCGRVVGMGQRLIGNGSGQES